MGFFVKECIIKQKDIKKGAVCVKEQEIIDLLIQKNEIGLSELIKHYEPLIKYIIAPILPNFQDREDCLSEISIRIWNKIDTYDSARGSLSVWITTISRNTALNYKRKALHYHNDEEINSSIPSNEPSPEDEVIRREKQAELNKALLQLSSKEKLLFYRKYYYLQSIAQIASETGMTEREVEGKLYRLKIKLRKILGGENNE